AKAEKKEAEKKEAEEPKAPSSSSEWGSFPGATPEELEELRKVEKELQASILRLQKTVFEGMVEALKPLQERFKDSIKPSEDDPEDHPRRKTWALKLDIEATIAKCEGVVKETEELLKKLGVEDPPTTETTP